MLLVFFAAFLLLLAFVSACHDMNTCQRSGGLLLIGIEANRGHGKAKGAWATWQEVLTESLVNKMEILLPLLDGEIHTPIASCAIPNE